MRTRSLVHYVSHLPLNASRPNYLLPEPAGLASALTGSASAGFAPEPPAGASVDRSRINGRSVRRRAGVSTTTNGEATNSQSDDETASTIGTHRYNSLMIRGLIQQLTSDDKICDRIGQARRFDWHSLEHTLMRRGFYDHQLSSEGELCGQHTAGHFRLNCLPLRVERTCQRPTFHFARGLRCCSWHRWLRWRVFRRL